MKIGILRETKIPPDRRVPLTPAQCRELKEQFTDLELVVQPSENRCFTDEEYADEEIDLQEELSDCDILLGVKEVDIDALIPGKTFLFFSHTAKEQPYNRKLLQAIAENGITLVDYEYLTRPDNTRVVAFGRWAGIVGAYNGLRAFGLRRGTFELEPAWMLQGLKEMKEQLEGLAAGRARIVLTGGGRVANGAVEILRDAGIWEVKPEDFLERQFNGAVFTRLDPWHYTRHREGKTFDFGYFVSHPSEYENTFFPYAKRADLYIACHFWDPDSPVLLTREDLRAKDMTLRVIADISCDIDGPIASTIRPSTIEDPLYGYDPQTGLEADDLFGDDVITVMAVDNLPGELPRDASQDFGRALLDNVMESLLEADSSGVIKRATIVSEGELTPAFAYLENYLEGAE